MTVDDQQTAARPVSPTPELGRVSRVWGARCMPLVYDPFLSLGELRGMRRLRAEVVGRARGRVLELGAGTGLNVRHFASAQEIVLTEPDPAMVRRLQRRLRNSSIPGKVVAASAEQLPFGDDSFDTVVATLAFCTIPDPLRALEETRRVLAPDGRLLFIEHVRAEAGSTLQAWQNRLYRPWRAFAYGCRCNQDTLGLLATAGLRITSSGTARWRGMPPLVRPIVYGEAEPEPL